MVNELFRLTIPRQTKYSRIIMMIRIRELNVDTAPRHAYLVRELLHT